MCIRDRLYCAQDMLDFFQIKQQLLHPQCGALTHSSRLSRLEMGKGKSGKILILIGKLGQYADEGNQLLQDDLSGLVHEDQIGVVSHIAGGSAQVDDGTGMGALLAVGVYLSLIHI